MAKRWIVLILATALAWLALPSSAHGAFKNGNPPGDARLAAVDEVSYSVEVIDGSGAGFYAPGEIVTVSAGAPAPGKQFREWAGAEGLTFVSGGHTGAASSFVMPDREVSLTAVYGDVFYAVTVNGGTGSGHYTAGTSVTVTAGAPPQGKLFQGWAGAETLLFLSGGTNSATVSFEMPAEDVALTAVYVDITYSLFVANGSGDGQYAAGVEVRVTADAPPLGMRFRGWSGAEGLRFVAGDTSSPSAVFIMPARDVNLTPEYEWPPMEAEISDGVFSYRLPMLDCAGTTLLIGCYRGDGCMLGVQVYPAPSASGEAPVAPADYYRAFVVDTATFVPQCESWDSRE